MIKVYTYMNRVNWFLCYKYITEHKSAKFRSS